jgi:hypothetical protein
MLEVRERDAFARDREHCPMHITPSTPNQIERRSRPWPWLPQCLLGECYVYRINPKLGGVERAAGGLTEAMARRIAEMLNSREELA